MRFSIRWLLAVMAYIAVLAATIGSGSQVLVDLVWAVPILVFCYAVVVACIDRGKRRAMAIGFVALSAAHVVCMYLVPRNVPAIRLYEAAGYRVSYQIQFGPLAGEAKLARGPIRPDRVVYQNTATGLVPNLRTSNGVVTLVAGLIGCLIGLLAYRHASGS